MDSRPRSEFADAPSAAAPFSFVVPSALAGIALCIAAIVVYAPVMNGDFIWDDDAMVTANPIVTAPGGLRRIWVDPPLDYFPVTMTAIWLEYRLWGPNAPAYHVTNILLHAVNALLVWRVLLALHVPGAWLAALLFAVHPANAATVAWIAEHKNTIAQLFLLCTLLAWVRFERTARRPWYAAALVLFLAALLSKTSVVMLPVVLLLLAWWMHDRVTTRDIVRTLPFFGASLVMGLVTIWFQHNRAIGDEVIPIGGPLERLVGAGFAAGFYLYSVLAPVRLMAIYPRWHETLPLVARVAIGLSMLVPLALAWRRRASWGKPVLVGLGFFLVTLVPVLGFVEMSHMRLTLVADHFLYLPMLGVVALVAGGAAVAFERTEPRLRPAWIVVTMVVVGMLSVLTWEQAAMRRNEETLWRTTLALNPDTWNGHNHYGAVLYAKNDFAGAHAHFARATALKPDNPEAHSNLGLSLMAMGRVQEAIVEYREALRIEPNQPTFQSNLGIALLHDGRVAEGIALLETALRRDPTLVEARDNLAAARGALESSRPGER